ncbi:MAG: hypothetical protein IPJ81_05410 [Chitinophagaceae bacterium]|nr:hypothetical protein [Chitinophagaceae bacterium]
MLLYEDLILFNPLFNENEARHFCTGKYGASELFFLKVHKTIEELFEPLIETTCKTLSRFYIKPFTIKKLLKKAIEIYDEIIRSLFSLHLIPVDHFQLFRQYFYSSQKDSKGVSGRFSAQTFHFRILLDGQDLSKIDLGFFSDIFNNAKYYPRKHLNKLISSVQERFLLSPEDKSFLAKNKPGKEKVLKTISELVIDNADKELYALLAELRHKADKFTAVHFEMAHRFIIKPNKLQASDTFSGTGGEIDIEKYLDSRINIHKKIGKLYANLNYL